MPQVSLDVTGGLMLHLVIAVGSEPEAFDHTDSADARLTCSSVMQVSDLMSVRTPDAASITRYLGA